MATTSNAAARPPDAEQIRKLLRARSSVPHQHVFGAVLVMHGKFIHHRCAGSIEADDFDFSAFATELDDHLIQRTHRRDVPEMGATNVDADFLNDFLEIEGTDE